MAPAERPDPDDFLADGAAEVELAPGAVAVLVGKRGDMDEVFGRRTFWQRDSTFEFAQQESVALGELWAQNEQRPFKLDW